MSRYDYDYDDVEMIGPERVEKCSVCQEDATCDFRGYPYCDFHERRERAAHTKYLSQIVGRIPE